MKPVISSFFIILALTSTAHADPYPSQQEYTNCRLEFTGNYYYVSRNGQRFTELTSNIQQALQQQSQLAQSGSCEYSHQTPGTCQLEFTGNYYYVSRNGTRMSGLVSDYRTSLNTRDLLYQSRNCDENTYHPNLSCKIEFTNNYYYVSRNGNRFSALVSDLNQATNTRDDLARNYVCQAQHQQQSCRLEYTGNYYYISINSQRTSELVPELNQALSKQRTFSERGMCWPVKAERCTIEYTGNYYYVARNGSRLSELVSNLSQADTTLRELRYSQNCY